ncbi:MAG: YdcF family protein, partial [Burkholderiales bacterium]|nr:YdcF family protein [Burkholderiales bacterium]
GHAGFDIGTTRVWLGDWRFELGPKGYHARVHGADFAYQLDLQPDGPPLLQGQAGISRIVLVTHGWHMPRSQRAFQQAIAASGAAIALTPAPMSLAQDDSRALLRWLPSAGGFESTRVALREMLGLLAGA